MAQALTELRRSVDSRNAQLVDAFAHDLRTTAAQISRALHKELQDIGVPAIITRDEQNYLPEIVEFMADRKMRLEAEYDAYISAANYRRHRELGRREAILQLGIMRYSEAREAAAVINIHVDDQLRRGRRRIAEAKGFSVILNKTASAESERLQREICSALRKTLPFNRSYRITGARRGIFILGNNELRVKSSAFISGGSASRYVVTNGSGELIQEGIGAGIRDTSVLFPVGANATRYTPASILNTLTPADFSVEVDGTADVVDAVRIPHIAASLGGVESLIEQPAVMSYYEMTTEQRAAIGIHDGLVRLAVGIKDVADLVADLDQALG